MFNNECLQVGRKGLHRSSCPQFLPARPDIERDVRSCFWMVADFANGARTDSESHFMAFMACYDGLLARLVHFLVVRAWLSHRTAAPGSGDG